MGFSDKPYFCVSNRRFSGHVPKFALDLRLGSDTALSSGVGLHVVGRSMVVRSYTIPEATRSTGAANRFVRRQRGEVAVGRGNERRRMENLHSLDGE